MPVIVSEKDYRLTGTKDKNESDLIKAHWELTLY